MGQPELDSSVQYQQKNSPLGDVPLLPPFLSYIGATSTIDVIISSGTGQPLIEGNYRKLVIKKNQSLILDGGFYSFAEFKIDKESTLTCAATCVVLVSSEFEIEKQAQVKATSGNSNDFTFYIASTNSENDEGEHHDSEVEIGKASQIVANIYAPYSELEIEKNNIITGHLIAREIEVALA